MGVLETIVFYLALKEYSRLVEQHVWAAVDGLKLLIQQFSNWHIKQQFFNGWKEDTFVNGVFVFALDGRICTCMLNCPGRLKDSSMSNFGVYERIERVFNTSGGSVVAAQQLVSNRRITSSRAQHRRIREQ